MAFSGNSNGSEVILQPAETAGADPFTDSVTNPRVERLTSNGGNIAGEPVPGVNGGDTSIESVDGSTSGLYGGTEQEDACDPGALVAFLAENPGKARAWAGAQGIDSGEIDSYVSALTPVILREDTRVTNNGFADGHATPFQAILQAGTAVLVDDHGIPRVRCACGNPLSEPSPTESEPDYSGPQWSRFDSNRLVSVSPAAKPIKSFRLVDVRTGREFDRAAGAQDLVFSRGRNLYRVSATGRSGAGDPLDDGRIDGEPVGISSEGGITALSTYQLASSESAIQLYAPDTGIVSLTTVKSPVSDLQVVDDRVFWTDAKGLSSISIDGSDLATNDIALPQEVGGGVAEGLAYDGAYIYFSRCQDGTIGRVRPDGTELDVGFITLFDGCPQGLDVADGRLYWTEFGLGDYDPSRVGRASTGGGDVQDFWLQTGDSLGPTDVAVSGQHVFWSHSVTEAEGGLSYVGRANLDGTNANPSFLESEGGTSGLLGSAIAVSHPAPAEAPEPLTIDERGVGDLKLGTPLNAGVKSDLVASTQPGCALGTPVPTNAILAPPLQGSAEFFSSDGEPKLTSIAVTAGVVTPEGITIGSDADDVVAAYPDARVESGTAGDVLDAPRIVLGSTMKPTLTFLLNHDGGVVTTIGVPYQAICE